MGGTRRELPHRLRRPGRGAAAHLPHHAGDRHRGVHRHRHRGHHPGAEQELRGADPVPGRAHALRGPAPLAPERRHLVDVPQPQEDHDRRTQGGAAGVPAGGGGGSHVRHPRQGGAGQRRAREREHPRDERGVPERQRRLGAGRPVPGGGGRGSGPLLRGPGYRRGRPALPRRPGELPWSGRRCWWPDARSRWWACWSGRDRCSACRSTTSRSCPTPASDASSEPSGTWCSRWRPRRGRSPSWRTSSPPFSGVPGTSCRERPTTSTSTGRNSSSSSTSSSRAPSTAWPWAWGSSPSSWAASGS